MSKQRASINGGWPRGKCWCGKPCVGRRTAWCSDACAHAFKLKHWPSYLRGEVERRDHGVCAICALDTVALHEAFAEVFYGAPWARGPAWYDSFDDEVSDRARALGFDPRRRTWWDADHIVAVVEGGGECGLENMRTLCQPCHRRITADLRHRLRQRVR